MRYPNRWKFISFLLLFMAAPAMAQMIFERADIRIDPAPSAPVKEGEPTPPQRVSYNYNIEVRSEDALQLEYIHTLNTMTDRSGVAILFSAPTVVALPMMQVFTPVDALFVAGDGTILQIYPNVVLGQLQQEIYAKDPISAFIFLKSGETALRGIHPRDIVTSSIFTPAPPVLE
jgi:hypothetical protein